MEYIIGENGNITVGIKEDNKLMEENPHIVSEGGYGIYNKAGTFGFYDGKIEASIKAVYDTVTEIEEGATLNYDDEEKVVNLTKEPKPLVKIGEKTYTNLQDAIDSCGNEETNIKLIRNAYYTKNDTTNNIGSEKNIIFDLNGYTFNSAILNQTINNNGALEIIDSSEGKNGMMIVTEGITIFNSKGATLKISTGILENRTDKVICNEGNLQIDGGVIKGTKNGLIYCVYNTGNVNMTNGTLIAKEENGGSIESYGIYNCDNGTVEFNGGIITSEHYYGGKSYGIYNNGSKEIVINGGTIDITEPTFYENYSYGVCNASSGKVTINSVEIISTGRYITGIINSGIGTIEFKRGSLRLSAYWGRNQYGIYNESTGTIVLGDKDNVINNDSPMIVISSSDSSVYGVYNPYGTLKIYDGTIKSSESCIKGKITEIEDLSKLNVSSETINGLTYEVIKLEKIESNVVVANNIGYSTIGRAVKACGINQSVIQLVDDVEQGETINIKKEQNITIDLNGHTIKNYNELTNKGTLKIIDTSTEQTGKILSYKGTAISNSGTMGFESGSISDSIYAIRNTGTLNITGGTIANNTYGIYNEINGISTILNGNITNNTYGIYNYSNNAVTNIKGGKIESNEYGLYNDSGTTNIASLGIGNNTYGIYNAKGSVNILEVAKIQSKTGIYNASGTVNIGEIGKMNSEGPVIIGETYGLVNSATGTVYMYDGQIKGKTGAIQGFITNTEEGYTIASKSDGDYEIDYLVLSGTITTVAQVNGIDYANLQSAINSVRGEETQTIKLTNGMITTETFTINEGQDIILDMNGKTISSDLDVTIVNKGKLTIIDTSEKNVAQISSTVGVAINNTGTLTLGKDDGTVSKDIITIEGKSYGITTSGIFNFYDGTIKGTSAVNGIINNKAIGYTVKVTTIDSKEYCYLST